MVTLKFLTRRILHFGCFTIFVCPLFLTSQIDVIAESKLTFEKDGIKISSRYYSTHPLQSEHQGITNLVIVVHGTNRNADDYFENMKTALTQRPLKVSSTAIIAPQYLTESDIDFHGLSEDHVYWSSDGWKSGSNSRDESSNPRDIRIPSFEVQDTLIMRSLRSFPNLRQLVFTGHSAGGQFTNRYTASSPIFEILCIESGISSKSIIANPGTYVYMSPERRVGDSETEFAIPDIDCPDYNEWSFGLEDLFVYPTRAGAEQIKEWYRSREVVYLLGQNDNDPNASTLPRSCRAMTFGNHRYERGMIYYNHIVKTLGEEVKILHSKVEIPNIGHNNFEMYNSEEGLRVLFDEAPLQSCNTIISTKEITLSDLAIYPNPAEFKIRINNDNLEEIETLQIMDIRGQVQLKFGETRGTNEFDISQLSSGIYWIKIYSKKKIFISKFIKT